MPSFFGSTTFSGFGVDTVTLYIDISNDSLAQIGHKLLVDVDDESKAAQYCSIFIPPAVKFVLRDHFWNFATSRAELTAGDTPLFKWQYSYSLPTDFVRMKSLNESKKAKWQVEGLNLLTNESQAFIEYIFLQTDPTVWDAMFREAFTVYLASKLAGALTSQPKLQMEKFNMYRALIIEAASVDGQEQGRQPSAFPDDLTRIRD